jgi:hypothetical protein
MFNGIEKQKQMENNSYRRWILTKRLQLIIIMVCVLLAPTLIFAGANKFGVAKATPTKNNLVVVPIEISNDVELAALDIPLSFSEGVTLKEVNFEGTRVEYFDLKVSKIDNENKTVVIGLLPQMSAEKKPDLPAGQGSIANLVFEVNDPSITEISLNEVVLSSPHHSLSFVSRNKDKGITATSPEFTTTTVSLAKGAGIPESFELAQNYPNPFNPSTQISYSLPTAGDVTITVFNVLGQKVTTLVDGQKEAGVHIVEFDGSSFSSGMYFYRIDTENFSDTKKMVMLK